jgi:pilus assembly protein CpaC
MLKTLLFILFISLNISAQEAAKESNLSIAIGIDEVIKLQYKYNTKVQIGNPKIVSLILAPSRREITFRGKNAGKTSVTVRDAAGDIRDKFIVNVSADGTSQIVRELRDLIGNIEGIEVLIKGGKVVVEGMIVVPGDIGRINTVLSQYREVLRLIELSPQTQRVIARKMQEEINKNNMKDVTVRIVNGDFWIEGVVNSEQKKVIATEIAQQYLPDKLDSLAAQSGGSSFQAKAGDPIVNFISVNEKKDPEPPAKLVKISAQFVELSKDYQKIFGFSWNPTLTSGGSISFGKTDSGDVTTNENDTLSGTIASLFPKLSSARQAGYARVIQSAMLITKDRKQATVSKSRAVPYSIGAGDLQTTGNATFNFTLTVTPSIGDKEIVNLDSLTISVALPAARANGGQPTSTNNSITTNVAVKSKESAAIGGIVQSSSSTNYDKDVQPPNPEAGTQLLFNLGRGKSYTTDKAQFVVFVTPEIIESAADGTNEIRKKFRKRER